MAILKAANGLHFLYDCLGLRGSVSSWSSVLGLLVVGSSASLSEDGGTEDCTLLKGKSTSQVRGVVAKAWPDVKLSSSLLGIRRSSVAISELYCI